MCEWTLAASALSTLAGAAGQIQRGREQAALYRHNRALADRQALIAEQRARAEAARIREEGAGLLGRQRAGFARAGVALEGTPLDVLGDTAAAVDRDARDALYRGALRADDYRTRAAREDFRASAVGSRIGVGIGTSLLRGSGSAQPPGRGPVAR